MSFRQARARNCGDPAKRRGFRGYPGATIAFYGPDDASRRWNRNACKARRGSPFSAGTNPAAVTVGPTGKFAYVANFGANTVSAYSINPATGALTAVPGSPFSTGNGPFSVTVDRELSGRLRTSADR